MMKDANIPFASTISDEPVTLPDHNRVEKHHTHSLSILIGGAAGTGIVTLENLLSDAFKQHGWYVFSTKEYMSRVRGGSNTTLLRIADGPVYAPCWHVDLCIALDENAIPHVQARLRDDTMILADTSINHEEVQIQSMPMIDSVRKVGSLHYINSYVAGVLFGIFGIDSIVLSKSIKTIFKEHDPLKNEAAMQEGFSYGKSLSSINLPKLPEARKNIVDTFHLINGSTAAGFGFLAGGCNMITSYPMSPSTAVLNFMASISDIFDVVVEQSEDEIASLNMVLGGWYGGARAMTSTSGGGFALMSEAMSLSGVSETPAVVYLAQRPGPATGLPTRTEQGDLNLAIHSGHGYFGRIVLAPGDQQECIDYAYLAFELADRYQMPVVYLSDQYLADSIGMLPSIDFSNYEQRRYIQPTESSYERYRLNNTGISPRGVPGLGEGLVVSSSHEHDERGQSTESYQIREDMVKKRKQKVDLAISEAHAPKVMGKGSIAIIGWGSTKYAISEVLKALNDQRLFHVHFTWVHPLNPAHLEILKNTEINIVIENNVSGEFADILKRYEIQIDHTILQSNGFPFFTDQLKEELSSIIKDLR